MHMSFLSPTKYYTIVKTVIFKMYTVYNDIITSMFNEAVAWIRKLKKYVFKV